MGYKVGDVRRNAEIPMAEVMMVNDKTVLDLWLLLEGLEWSAWIEQAPNTQSFVCVFVGGELDARYIISAITCGL